MDCELRAAECEVLVAPIDGAVVEHEADGLGEISAAVRGDGVGLVVLGVELAGEGMMKMRQSWKTVVELSKMKSTLPEMQ